MPTAKKLSELQENNIAQYLGWGRVAGSGARPTLPGDVSGNDWLGECKTHTTPFVKIRFQSKIWNKIADEAASKFKQPVYFSDDGSQKLEKTWVIFKPIELRVPYNPIACPFASENSVNFYHSVLVEKLKAYQVPIPLMQFMWNLPKPTTLWLSNIETFRDILEGQL